MPMYPPGSDTSAINHLLPFGHTPDSIDKYSDAELFAISQTVDNLHEFFGVADYQKTVYSPRFFEQDAPFIGAKAGDLAWWQAGAVQIDKNAVDINNLICRDSEGNIISISKTNFQGSGTGIYCEYFKFKEWFNRLRDIHNATHYYLAGPSDLMKAAGTAMKIVAGATAAIAVAPTVSGAAGATGTGAGTSSFTTVGAGATIPTIAPNLSILDTVLKTVKTVSAIKSTVDVVSGKAKTPSVQPYIPPTISKEQIDFLASQKMLNPLPVQPKQSVNSLIPIGVFLGLLLLS